MSLSITNDSKNTLSVSNDSKDNAITWAEHDGSWANSGNKTWGNPGRPFNNDSKNSLSITNDSKV